MSTRPDTSSARAARRTPRMYAASSSPTSASTRARSASSSRPRASRSISGMAAVSEFDMDGSFRDGHAGVDHFFARARLEPGGHVDDDALLLLAAAGPARPGAA